MITRKEIVVALMMILPIYLEAFQIHRPVNVGKTTHSPLWRSPVRWVETEDNLFQKTIGGLRARSDGPGVKLLSTLTPEEEAEQASMEKQLSKLENIIQTKTREKRLLEKEIDELFAQKRSIQLQVNTLAPSVEIASETPMRSLLKACSWRFVAALITLSTSLFFSGDAKMAASIVSSDFLSKAGTMYMGERLWNKVNWGKKEGRKQGDLASRSILKALAWRGFAMVNTLIISIFFAKSVKIAGQIASTDTIIKTSLYVVHERLWANIEWGREYQQEYNI